MTTNNLQPLNPKVDAYLALGCGRCAYHATPKCKVRNWRNELELLREIVLSCGLVEELKWGVPTYTHQGKNLLIVAAFKEFCSISFLNGSLLSDPEGILQKAGENSQIGRLIKFTSEEEITQRADVLKAYIQEAMKLQEQGAKVVKTATLPTLPAELLEAFEDDPQLKAAFYALTPGRQRGYLIHFSQPKQAATRTSRIAQSKPKILLGLGLNDRGRS